MPHVISTSSMLRLRAARAVCSRGMKEFGRLVRGVSKTMTAQRIPVWLAVLLLATIVTPSAQGAIFSTDTTIAEANFTYEGQDIVVDRATLTLNGAHRFRSMVLTNGAMLTHSHCTTDQTYKLDVTVTNLFRIMRDSSIDVQGRGYRPGRTTGNSTVGASTGNSGASYGGAGGSLDGVTNAPYGDPDLPNDWGERRGWLPGTDGGRWIDLDSRRSAAT